MNFLLATTAVIAAAGIWFMGRKFAVRSTLDLMDLILGIFLLCFVLRPAMLVFGLDEPWPDGLVNAYELDWTASVALSCIMVWMLLLVVASNLGYRVAGKPWHAGYRYRFTSRDMVLAAGVLTLLSLIVVLPQIDALGGTTALAIEAKLGRDDEALVERWRRQPSLIGTVWAVAAVVSIRQEARKTGRFSSRSKLLLVSAVLLYGSCAYMSFVFGARDALVFGLLAMLISPFVGVRFNSKKVFRLFVVVVSIILVAASFRLLRDYLIHGQTDFVIGSGQSPARSLALAANLLTFDSLMLAFRDFPSSFSFFGVVPFLEGLRGLPLGELFFGPDDPRFANVSQETLRMYLPNRRNGNPITAIGDWYVSFGFLGLTIGALLSGLFLGWVQKKLSLFPVRPLLYVVGVFLATRYLLFGVWANTSVLLFNFAVPLLLSVLGMAMYRYYTVKAR